MKFWKKFDEILKKLSKLETVYKIKKKTLALEVRQKSDISDRRSKG